MPDPLVILHPGVRTTAAAALGKWRDLGAFIFRETGINYRVFWPGYIKATASGARVIGRCARRAWLRRWQVYVLELQRANPHRPIHVVAHSLGTRIIWRSLTAGGPGSLFLGRLVLMAGVVSSRATWADQTGHYEAVLNLYSPEDEIARFNGLGHCGWKGFSRLPKGSLVRNQEMAGYEHGDYLRPGAAWTAVAKFLTS